MNDSVLIYDGSLEGLLTCIFQMYELKLFGCHVQKQNVEATTLFNSHFVQTEPDKAARVWTGLSSKAGNNAQHNLLSLYLSELPEMEEIFVGYVQYIFSSNKDVQRDFSNKYILRCSQIERKVHREKHRMEAFVRFKLTNDNIYFATIEPDYNVMPLIMPHFRKRYADQQWIIYDIKRNYGLHYNLKNVVDVVFQFNSVPGSSNASLTWFDEKEELYQSLWKTYFKSTNIIARKNYKLHLQHIPKRYWKYLIEKQ